jgi:hypothetical protein
VRGISENARSEIVNKIEHNAKNQRSSVGLYPNPKTGELTPISRPTSPAEQFCFAMIKQALVRHYFVREKLNGVHLNPQNPHIFTLDPGLWSKLPAPCLINFQEYVKTLPVLKATSDQAGESEIRTLALANGTEIIAKKLNPEKLTNANLRNEYDTLKKATEFNLPCPQPLGLVLPKQAGEPGYLLMEKVNGISARGLIIELNSLGKNENLSKEKQMRLEYLKKVKDQIITYLQELVSQFQAIGIDKSHWRVKDTIVQFDSEGNVSAVCPIDFERAKEFDPENPGRIH